MSIPSIRVDEYGVVIALDIGTVTAAGSTAAKVRIWKPDGTKQDVDIQAQFVAAGGAEIVNWTIPKPTPFDQVGRHYLQVEADYGASKKLFSEIVPLDVDERLYLSVVS